MQPSRGIIPGPWDHVLAPVRQLDRCRVPGDSSRTKPYEGSMRKLMLLVACCAWASVLQGCGPLQVPMASRPDDETQKSIDAAWNEALSPPNRYDHQGLLDLLLVARAYEAGVDRLTFRSEKQVVRGTV